MQEIEHILSNIEIEKQNLEHSLETLRKQYNEQANTIFRQTAELNKLSTEKSLMSERIKEYK